MFLKSKGYLLIESMVSLTIFIIAISLGNVVILRVFKYNTFENFEKIEVSYIFLDNLYRKIKMLDNDSNIEVKGDNVLILKEKEIKTKYEFSNGYIYVSNSKIKKRIIKCVKIAVVQWEITPTLTLTLMVLLTHTHTLMMGIQITLMTHTSIATRLTHTLC